MCRSERKPAALNKMVQLAVTRFGDWLSVACKSPSTVTGIATNQCAQHNKTGSGSCAAAAGLAQQATQALRLAQARQVSAQHCGAEGTGGGMPGQRGCTRGIFTTVSQATPLPPFQGNPGSPVAGLSEVASPANSTRPCGAARVRVMFRGLPTAKKLQVGGRSWEQWAGVSVLL